MLDETANSISYQGGESQSVFPIPFPFLATSHLRAHIRRADGIAKALAAGSDYAVNMISDAHGEFVLLGDDLPEGSVLTISRLTPLTQDIFFHNQGPNSPRAIEEAADKLTMIAQELDGRIEECREALDNPEIEFVSPELTETIIRVDALKEEVDAVRESLELKADGSALEDKADRRHAHAVADVGTLTESLAEIQDKADRAHTHAVADVQNLSTALARIDDKAGLAHTHAVADVQNLSASLARIDGKAGLDHTHAVAEVRDLAESLAQIDDKAGLEHTHTVAEVQNLSASLARIDGKAGLDHTHAVADVQDLSESLAQIGDKANRNHTHAVAEVQGLAGTLALIPDKADREHGHAVADVENLTEALAQKLGVNDSRLDGMALPAAHAAAHFSGGADRIRPNDIGAMTRAPTDGKSYFAAGDGWVEYIPPDSGDDNEGVGTMDHSLLLNRNAANQHPQSAIQDLTANLEDIRGSIAELAVRPSPIPSDGASGDFLVQGENATVVWRNAAAAANLLPVMTTAQKGVAKLAANSGLQVDAGGSLAIQANHLVNKTDLDATLSSHNTRLNTVEGQASGIGSLTTRVTAVETDCKGLNTALAAKAPLASPALTGKPTVPTAAAGTSTTQAASTAFVQTAVNNKAAGYLPLTGGTLTGSLTVPTAAAGTSTTQAATTAFVQTAVDNKAAGYLPLTGGTLTGSLIIPTAAAGNNTAQAATTAFVQAAVNNKAAGYLPLTGGTLTGSLTIPTAAAGNNTTLAATTAFVQTAVDNKAAGYLPLAGGTLTGSLSLPGSGNISFGSATGTKLNLYGGTYTIGIESSTLAFTCATNNQHKWYSGATALGYWNKTDLYVGTTGVLTTLNLKAPLASPALTGTPTAPTAATATSTTQVATTAYVKNQGYATVTQLNAATARVTALETSNSQLGAMSVAADAPKDGKEYVRKDGAWVEKAADGGGGSAPGAYQGEIRMLPFRRTELPAGWYFCNGDRFELATPQGEALYSLSTQLKTDWGIAVSGSTINVPNLFTGNDGYYFRSVNNSTRYPGNKQADAMIDIVGKFQLASNVGLVWHTTGSGSSTLSGPFYSSASKSYGVSGVNYGSNATGDLSFDLSRVASTASEVRTKNIGMSPAIYLGA